MPMIISGRREDFKRIIGVNFKGVIFDLDGTLLDTLADIGNSMNCVLERHGFPTHHLNSYKLFVGNGARYCRNSGQEINS